MKRLFIAVLLCIGVGCTQNAKRILPPIYEQYYPLIIGIRSYENGEAADIDSMLAAILIASGFAAGVLEEPFDTSMVDILLSIDEITILSTRSGFIPTLCELEGKLVVQVLHPRGTLIERYSAEAKVEQRSLNPFHGCNGTEVLCGELITSILDDIDEHFQKDEPVIVHSAAIDEKAFEGEAHLEYPTLTHFSKNGIYAAASIEGRIPVSTVTLHVSEKDGESFFSHQLYYEKTHSMNGKKEWLYAAHFEEQRMPFSKMLVYEIESVDAMGRKESISSGTLRTISGGMYRFKQIEVLTQGTIITAFGGLVILMLGYSI